MLGEARHHIWPPHFLERWLPIFFKRSDNCLKESGLFLGFSSLVWRVGRWQPVAFLEAGSQNLGEYSWELK